MNTGRNPVVTRHPIYAEEAPPVDPSGVTLPAHQPAVLAPPREPASAADRVAYAVAALGLAFVALAVYGLVIVRNSGFAELGLIGTGFCVLGAIGLAVAVRIRHR